MTSRKQEPEWLTAKVVFAVHDDLLARFGGMFGVRDAGLLESALARPQNRWENGEAEDLFECAASYGFGIAKKLTFNAGNKRTAYMSMYTFLGLNGLELTATEIDAVETMVAVADGSLSQKRLAVWLRENCAKDKPKLKAKRKK